MENSTETNQGETSPEIENGLDDSLVLSDSLRHDLRETALWGQIAFWVVLILALIPFGLLTLELTKNLRRLLSQEESWEGAYRYRLKQILEISSFLLILMLGLVAHFFVFRFARSLRRSLGQAPSLEAPARWLRFYFVLTAVTMLLMLGWIAYIFAADAL